MKARSCMLILTLLFCTHPAFSGEIVCWGWNGFKGEITNSPAGNDYIAIAAGYSHTAALKENGDIVVWGQT